MNSIQITADPGTPDRGLAMVPDWCRPALIEYFHGPEATTLDVGRYKVHYAYDMGGAVIAMLSYPSSEGRTIEVFRFFRPIGVLGGHINLSVDAVFGVEATRV
jgi:hypothetical protein